MSFKNKVVWITGASSGIGKALAIEFSKQNALLILSSRNEVSLSEVKKLCSQPENVGVIPLDLQDYLNFEPIVKKAIDQFGRVDILINNGGISQRALASDTKVEIDKRFMDINYMGAMALSKGLLPHFVSNKSGHFVTITSVSGKIGTPKRSAYAASKHALHGFFDCLRAEVYNNNINVTLVTPGYIQTNLGVNALKGDGSNPDKIDLALDKGMPSAIFAKKMIKAIKNKKNEVAIGGPKEVISLYLKRFFPNLLAKIVRNVNADE